MSVLNRGGLLRDLIRIKQSLTRIRTETKTLLRDLNIPRLSLDQRELVKSVWGDIHVNEKWFSYFNSFREDGEPWSPYYVPADLHYGIVDMYYTNYQKCRIMEDKNFNDFIYEEVCQPQTILRGIRNDSNKEKTLYLDESYHILSEKEILTLLSDVENAIVKPSIDSGGGKNIVFLDSSMTEQQKWSVIKTIPDVIVQSIVSQHEHISVFNQDSLNTIRLVSFITGDGDVRILSSSLRMGVDNKKLDNAHSGGIFVGIDNNGRLRKTAHNLAGQFFLEHPSSGILFEGYHVDGIDKCERVVKSLAPKFYGLSRLISWDMAVSNLLEPVLIEANMTFGGCDIPQISNGPLFGDYTNEMLREVFSNRKNKIIAKLI